MTGPTVRPRLRGRPRVVVVGVDESPSAGPALAEGLRTAARRGDRLRIVAAYDPPGPTYRVGGWPAPLFGPWQEVPPPSRVAIEGAVLQRIHRLLAATLHELDLDRRDRPEIEVEALPGHPVEVLVREAAGADELVVGRRGRGAFGGAFGGAVLGSVGLGCVLHAPCPVTVVPSPVPTGSGDGATRPDRPSVPPGTTAPRA